MAYNKLSEDIQQKIIEDRKNNWVNPYACRYDAIRRNPDRDKANLWRPCYVRDIEKIMHSPYYNRYNDKTQVFSFIEMMI